MTCDRRIRLERGEAECSACDRHGLKCTFTWNPKRRSKNPIPYQIAGLTRTTLHACVVAYMRYAAPCMPVLDIGALVARVDEERDADLVVLATACMGAGLLEPAVMGAEDKFKLQYAMEKRFRELLLTKAPAESLDEKADVIEATYVMSDLITSQVSRPDDPLFLDALSYEVIARLVFEAGMHREPVLVNGRLQDCAGRSVSAGQARRMSRIFWSCFIQDTFRAFGRRRNALIRDEDYDTELPVWMLSPENDFDAPAHLAQRSSTAAFDSTQLQFMLRLAFVVRTISIKFVTPQAQGRGVAVADVQRATTTFRAWRDELPAEVVWEAVMAAGTIDEVTRRKGIKGLFLECLFLRQVIGTWSALCEYGLRQGEELPTPSPSTSMDELVLASFFRIAKLDVEAARLGLLRAQRGVLMDLAATYAIWGCALVQHMPDLAILPSQLLPLGPLALETTLVVTADNVLVRVAQLIDAVSTCDSSRDSGEIASRLRSFLAETHERHAQFQAQFQAGPQQQQQQQTSRDIHETIKGMQRQLRQYIVPSQPSRFGPTDTCFSVPERDTEPWQAFVEAQALLSSSSSSPSNDEALGALSVAEAPNAQRWATAAWNGSLL